jgi:hypothetical protein
MLPLVVAVVTHPPPSKQKRQLLFGRRLEDGADLAAMAAAEDVDANGLRAVEEFKYDGGVPLTKGKSKYRKFFISVRHTSEPRGEG